MIGSIPRKLTVTFLLLVALIGPRSASAADISVVTLDECIRKTLEYSRDVLIAAEGINTSQGRYIEERAAALPHLKAEAWSMGISEERTLYPGISKDRFDYSAGVNLTQALFTWGQIGAAIRAARYDKQSAEHMLREARQLAMREAAVSFFDLLLTIELEKVARDNVAQKQRHLDETVRRLDMEVATDYDALSARVALTNAMPPLAQAENDIRLARDRLRYYMGIQTEFEVAGTLICKTRKPESLEEVLERAKANRPEVAYYESRVGVFKELITVAKASNKPRLDFKSNAGYNSYEDIDKDYPGGRLDAGIFLSFPFFDGFLTKGRVIQARSRLAVTELEMKKLLDNIALEARSAINRVDEAVQIVDGLKATTSQAERLLEMAETGYKHGVKTKLEVDDAESNLLAARTNLAKARRDYLTARARLFWIMGEDLQAALSNPEYCPTNP